jgi:hypothetical protein
MSLSADAEGWRERAAFWSERAFESAIELRAMRD